MKKLLITFILILMLTSCNVMESGHFGSVGAYKYPDQPWYVIEDAKVMGHKGKNIFAPDPYDVEHYCSICHYVY